LFVRRCGQCTCLLLTGKMREELARLLDDLTGTVRLGNTDPRWESLLGCGSRVLGLSLSQAKVVDFCDAMLRNNPSTGNFGSLVALTVATADEALSIASAVAEVANTTGNGGGGEATAATATASLAARHSPEGFPRALAALRLTRLFAARIVSTLGASQVRAQFYSRGSRRDGDGPARGRAAGGRAAAGIAGGRGAAAAAAAGRASSGGGGGGGGGAITEGQEEAPEQNGVAAAAAAAPADPVTALLSSIMSLLCASGDEGGMAGRTPRRRNGGGGRGGGGVLSVEGFSDLQLEAVGLLLVLLGTQAYGPPPPTWGSSPGQATKGGGQQGASAVDNVFLDALLREASSSGGGSDGRPHGWSCALPRAVLGWFVRRPAAPPGSAS
ncbi:unnamed protein product, partial [Ectocarpus sp. 13 AM-2016]